jgi:hypothetical protein
MPLCNHGGSRYRAYYIITRVRVEICPCYDLFHSRSIMVVLVSCISIRRSGASFHRTRSSKLLADIRFNYKRNTLGPRCGRGASLRFQRHFHPPNGRTVPISCCLEVLSHEVSHGAGPGLEPWSLDATLSSNHRLRKVTAHQDPARVITVVPPCECLVIIYRPDTPIHGGAVTVSVRCLCALLIPISDTRFASLRPWRTHSKRCWYH